MCEKRLCECCETNIAIAKDSREHDWGYDEPIVCGNCLSLNNEWFYRLQKAKEGIGKKRIMGKIMNSGSWKDYIIKLKE